MDFMNRGLRNGQNENSTNAPQSAGASVGSKKSAKLNTGSWGKIGGFGFLIALVLIVVGVIFALMMTNVKNPEADSVAKGKYQAVFLNGGQVYFGNIADLNNKYIKLGNIYYLRVNQTVQPNSNTSANNDVSLVKLGCELHGPQDTMIINRDQVVFWENLKDDGQVVKAVNEYKKQYPNGQDCAKQNSTSTNTTDTTNNTATTNNSTNTTTNKTTTGTSGR